MSEEKLNLGKVRVVSENIRAKVLVDDIEIPYVTRAIVSFSANEIPTVFLTIRSPGIEVESSVAGIKRKEE